MPDMETVFPNVVELPDQIFVEFAEDKNFVLVLVKTPLECAIAIALMRIVLGYNMTMQCKMVDVTRKHTRSSFFLFPRDQTAQFADCHLSTYQVRCCTILTLLQSADKEVTHAP